MNIKQIREILGSEFDKVSDDDLLKLSYYLERVCDYAIDEYLKERKEEREKNQHKDGDKKLS